MWVDAQHDARPGKYRWHPLLNAAVWVTPTTRVPCSNVANIGEYKTWKQSEHFAPGKLPLGGRAPENAYIVQQPMRWPNIVQSLVDVC